MDRTPPTAPTRIARTAMALAILGGTWAASATALAEPPAGESPGRSAEAPGLQEEHPGQGTPPAHAAPQAQEHAAAPGAPVAGSGDAGAAVAGEGEEAPGNRGTIKTHLATTADDDRRDEPHFCEGRLVGFGFPEDADLEITIDGHGGPNSGPDTFDTTVSADMLSDTGDFALAIPTLADGMYKITADNVTAPGFAKQKVVKIECPVEVLPVEEEKPEIPPVIIEGEKLEEEKPDSPPVIIEGEKLEEEVLGELIERPVRTEPTRVEALSANEQVLGVQIQRGSLARTGTDMSWAVLVGIALLAGGTALVAADRRTSRRI